MAVRKPVAVAEPEEITALVPAAATPEVGEWRLIERQAKAIANTQLVPKAYQGKPEEIIAVALTAREIGIGMMQALRHLYIVDGKPTMSAELMVGLVRKRGHSVSGKSSAQTASVVGRRRDNGDVVEVTWTIDMARRAGLLTKQNWQKYPESMLWARAVSQVCRMLFPDCTGGIGYTLEELQSGDFVQGATVDQRTVAPVAAEDRDDAVDEALRGEVVDADDGDQKPEEPSAPKVELDGRPLSQRERDSLKERCGTMDDARRLTAEAYRALGIQSGGVWIGWEGEPADAKFAYLTAAHRDWIEARLA